MRRITDFKESVKEFKLDNGYINRYDMCDSASNKLESPPWLNKKGFVYLEVGIIYSINGAKQNIGNKYHFWRREGKNNE